ncbi:hypothetical protein H4R99_002711 [Coemansia sp. RSA 1722]|nr:hypothetical protein LPJ57_001197 [Coemansia sp. RSA 486]KAJ2228163.1 hypothetical protein IWW45_006718 [Coemansia sp. RSA 485]KAJ2602352.1 hypothetical protein H4R99_002711 [Coemansia sp. RSA 1722]KAJ2635489.1 hypothetical protein GGF40_003583 [Coemansia sp. RSA 1286]
MSIYTIYVPGHVDRSKIQPCLLDVHSTFVDIDLESFDVSAKLEEHKYFVVLDNNYFLVYEKEHPAGAKCDYKSRNFAMYELIHRYPSSVGFVRMLKEMDGIWAYDKLSVLYFVFKPNSDALRPDYKALYNTVVEFYDTAEEEDFEKFAEIAKTKDSCVSHFFVVNRESTYHIVDTNNPTISYKFSASRRHAIINLLFSNKADIQYHIEIDKALHEYKLSTKRDPNFQLHDTQGVPLKENETFMLRINNSEIEDNNDEDSDYEIELEYVAVSEDSPGHYYLYGALGNVGDIFSFKVVDNITYLTHKGGYVCVELVDPEETIFQITVEPEVPPKERRIQIYYAKDGSIALSQWNGDVYVCCNWIKCAYAAIGIDLNDWVDHWGQYSKFVIERVEVEAN